MVSSNEKRKENPYSGFLPDAIQEAMNYTTTFQYSRLSLFFRLREIDVDNNEFD